MSTSNPIIALLANCRELKTRILLLQTYQISQGTKLRVFEGLELISLYLAQSFPKWQVSVNFGHSFCKKLKTRTLFLETYKISQGTK